MRKNESYRYKNRTINFITIFNCNVTKTLNDHLVSHIEGHISEEEYEKAAKAGDLSIYATLEDDSSILVFRGFISDLEVDYCGHTRILQINAISATVILDDEPQFRTFQGQRQTYRNIIDEIVNRGEHTEIIYTAGKEERPGHIVVQYKESNWEFLKRLAGELGTVVVADCNNAYPCFYFGLPNRKLKKEISFLSMRVRQVQDIGKSHKFECLLLSREYLELCDLVHVKDQNWRVYEISMRMENGEILFEYKIEDERYKRTPIQKSNVNLKGLSILGTVREVKDAAVRVKLESDLDLDWGDGLWYEYATVYTAPDGTGWYCMPEAGEQVRLYFPDELENHAYVISGVHKEEERLDPDIKSFKTKYKKEIRFTPNEIVLTNNDGISISLHDENGIFIKSKKGITLHSDTAVDIRSNSKVSIKSREGISIRRTEILY